MGKGRSFETGTKSWTSSHDSADGKAIIVEVAVDGRTKKMTVPKEPLELRKVPVGFRLTSAADDC